ncbi:MAG: polyprenol monophosphomannose synthase [Anaerolineales bacterium]|uniref:polyprenol monophosphomannose synthase n=1 Tax=Candidatus Villigracilis affinis TaxID=3140682 RepID=UPI002A1F4EBF|nr:polyprenol monophosphomannose synthase [Anaerolineales bacterium]MBL0344519.1 polyprenol monophosphomannose synthase [Anaerolineales bacterium]
MRITVVTPTYNEAENLPKLVSALFSLPLDINVLVVDDNSPDGTGRVADELVSKYPGRIEVLHRPGKMGLRSAYLNGFQKVMDGSVDAIVQMDADFSHDPSALLDMASLLQVNDVVLGSRYVKGGSVDERWPLWRRSLSAFGNYYARTILGLPLHDVTTGYRMWRRETLQQVPFERIQSNGYVFLVEMAYLAHCLEFKIGEAPIYFADRRWGKSKMSIKIQMEAAFRIWQVWWHYRDLRKAGRSARL